MKLTTNDIKKILKGAVRIDEQDGKLSLCRFTKAQQEAYKEYSENFYMKSGSSAGMRLEFITDSKSLSLSAEMGRGSSKLVFAFDVYVEGALIKNVQGGFSDVIPTPFSFNVELPEGEKRVAVYLPWSASTTITEMTLDDGAKLEPIEKKLSMICFGDSISQGYIANCPSFTYTNRLADALGADIVNKGIGGEIFFPTLAALPDDFQPDIITVAYGTNDWAHSERDVFDKNSKLFYESLAKNYPNAKIFSLAPVWRPNYNTRVTKMGEFTHMLDRFREIAENIPSMTVIDCFEFIPHEKYCFAPDFLHPNDEGFRHYAYNLFAEIKKYI